MANECKLTALTGELSVLEQKTLLADAGFDPGVIGGLKGANTQKAINSALAEFDMAPQTLWDKQAALE